MSKLYLLVFSPEEENKPMLDRDMITSWLDKQSWAADGWFYNLPNSIFFKSTIGVDDISQRFEKEFGERRHFVIKIASPHWGRLPKDHWELFK